MYDYSPAELCLEEFSVCGTDASAVVVEVGKGTKVLFPLPLLLALYVGMRGTTFNCSESLFAPISKMGEEVYLMPFNENIRVVVLPKVC